MVVLVVGGAGMLGHQLVRQLRQDGFTVLATVRGPREAYAGLEQLLSPEATVFGVDVTRPERLSGVLDACRPQAVINCAGLVKQRREAADPVAAIELNALFPHRLAALCRQAGCRLLHFSTDCVFSGRAGNYPDDAPHDAVDLYGRSKSLGEVGGPDCLTLRTSIIGPELPGRRQGLLEWFRDSAGTVPGYTNVVFSGLTTLAMGRLVARLLTHHPHASGVYNVSTAPIAKHDLLVLLRDALDVPVAIRPDGALCCDRSLDSSRFQTAFGYVPPSWPAMVRELAEALRADGRG